MITSFTKNSTKWSLVGLAVILLISGCALTNAKTDVSQKGDNVIEYATQLKFAAVPTSELPAEKPEAGLKRIKGHRARATNQWQESLGKALSRNRFA